MRLSARNRVRGTVTSVTTGESATTVKLDAGELSLVASITTDAARDLNLHQGSEVTAIIKASDVILATEE